MTILIPAWSFYPSQEGGPSNALYWLASGLAKAGYDVCVVTTNRCLEPGTVIENTWQKLNGFNVVYATVDKLSKYLEEKVPWCDIMIANGVCSLRDFRFNVKALRLGKKVVLSPRGELIDSAVYHKGKLYGLLKTMSFTVMRLAYGKKVLYHATSEDEIEYIRKYMGKNARVVQIPNYMILSEKVDERFVDCTRRYLLYVGRINHIKNIDIIIKGLAKSDLFLNSDYTFKIAGETGGDYYRSLLALVDELGLDGKVVFLGSVTGKEKDKLYAGARCLLLMSKSENFGNVIVEALSQGTPIIASKGTPWKQLSERGSGWWIDATPEQVSETVNKVLSLDEDGYAKMRENAFAYSREYDIYTNSGKWVEVIENNCLSNTM